MKSSPAGLSLENTVQDLHARLDSQMDVAHKRLDEFAAAFRTRFTRGDSLEKRASTEAILWALMDTPVILHALGMNGSAILEVHSVVERYSIVKTPRFIARIEGRRTVERLLERRSLPEIAEILHKHGAINEQSLSWAKRVTKLRNGYAHKNKTLMQKAIMSKRRMHFLDIDREVGKVDCVHHILAGIDFLYQVFEAELSDSAHAKNVA